MRNRFQACQRPSRTARRGVKIGGTTGYFRAAAERFTRRPGDWDMLPDIAYARTMCRAGRPAPWMIFRIMEETGVCPPAAVVKIGDTIPDIEEGATPASGRSASRARLRRRMLGGRVR